MKKENVVQKKSYDFALRIIKLYKFLSEENNEYVLSRQVLRSGTSIGANIEEAIGAVSQKEFLVKLNIAYKEARETHYWIRLLKDSDYIAHSAFESIIADCDELLSIIGSISKTMKSNMKD